MNISILIAFWVICVAVLLMNIWGGWAEQFYENNKASKYSWYWLDKFRVEKTKDNCVKFLKIISWVGIIVITLSSILFLLKSIT